MTGPAGPSGSGVAVVTGGGRSEVSHGVGSAISVALAGAGLTVAVVDIDVAAAARTVSEIESSGGLAFPVIADLATREGCEFAMAAALNRDADLEVLVNNLAVVQPGSAPDISDDQWSRTININLTAAFRMSQLAVVRMRQLGRGNIVNISSIAGIRGGGNTVAYAASKAGMIGMTLDMAGSHGPEGIRVNAVVPGYLYTPMVAEFVGMDAMRQTRARLGALDTEGSCWDVAAAVRFLAGEDARWLAGAVIPVDAGAHALQPLAIATKFGLLGSQRAPSGT